ncbi:MAG: hydroxyacid dehydrogenase [Acetobacteraceae bacterium]|nr:hydroxyacid dehydrogenase [Acetobacteraceae bacterium]
MPHTIVVTEFMDEAAVGRLRATYPTLYDPGLVDAPDRLAAALEGARALIVRNRTRVDAALLSHGPGIRVVGRLGVGLDNIDLPACRARGVEVIPASGANADSVAEYVILAVGMLLRGAFMASAEVAAGGWPRARLSSGREMAGKTLGIVGFGDIGRRVAKLARAFGMMLIAHDPVLPNDHSGWTETPTERVSLEELFARADAVTLHVPLTEATRGLVSAACLARMKLGAVLVNTARGGVVDEAALAAALREGRLGGAALDVFETEPLPAGSPLADTPNLLLTPHIAGVTQESNTRVSSLIAERVLVALAMA